MLPTGRGGSYYGDDARGFRKKRRGLAGFEIYIAIAAVLVLLIGGYVMSSKLSKLTKDLNNARQELATITTDRSRLQMTVSSRDSEIRNKVMQVTGLQRDLESAREQHRIDVDLMKRSKEDLENAHREVHFAHSKTLQEKETVTQHHTACSGELAGIKARLEDCERTSNDRMSSLTDVYRKLDAQAESHALKEADWQTARRDLERRLSVALATSRGIPDDLTRQRGPQAQPLPPQQDLQQNQQQQNQQQPNLQQNPQQPRFGGANLGAQGQGFRQGPVGGSVVPGATPIAEPQNPELVHKGFPYDHFVSIAPSLEQQGMRDAHGQAHLAAMMNKFFGHGGLHPPVDEALMRQLNENGINAVPHGNPQLLEIVKAMLDPRLAVPVAERSRWLTRNAAAAAAAGAAKLAGAQPEHRSLRSTHAMDDKAGGRKLEGDGLGRRIDEHGEAPDAGMAGFRPTDGVGIGRP